MIKRKKYGTTVYVYLKRHLFPKKINFHFPITSAFITCDKQTGMCDIGGKMVLHEKDIRRIYVDRNTWGKL